MTKTLGNPLQPPDEEDNAMKHGEYRVEVISRLFTLR
jgi:hypothetical protein